MIKTMILMQGVPGSGKSTVAQALVGEGKIFSTDEFWGAGYRFDSTRLGEAHEWNQERAERSMAVDCPTVIIDNTNIKHDHVIPYLVLAAKYGYTVQVVRVSTDPALAAARNTHDVPAKVVFKMHREMEDLIDKGLLDGS